MRVLVCGGREYGAKEPERLHGLQCLSKARREMGITAIIEGGAPGADALARIFGEVASIPVTTFRADWRAHGKAAGPIRNQRMLDEGKPDAVVAFPGGAGTADMVRRATSAGIPVHHI